MIACDGVQPADAARCPSHSRRVGGRSGPCVVVDSVDRLGKHRARLQRIYDRITEANGFIVVLLSPGGSVIDTRTLPSRRR